MKNKKSISLLLSVAFSLSACSVIDGMKEMEKNTVDMNDTTTELQKSTEEMKQTTEELKELNVQVRDRIEDAYNGGRMVSSGEFAVHSFKDIVEAKGTLRKARFGIEYFVSREFQHWQGDYEDNLGKRERMMARAVENLMADITDFIVDSHPVEGSTDDNDWLVLNIVAVTMSRVDDVQKEVAARTGVPVYSVYDMIIEGLRRQEEYERGEDVPEYVKRVQENRGKAVYLLQLRQAFFPILVLGWFTDIEEKNTAEKYLLIQGVSKLQFDFDRFAQGEFVKPEKWMRLAWETQQDMKDLGIEPIAHPNINFIFTKANYRSSEPENFQVPNGFDEPEEGWTKKQKFYWYFKSVVGFTPQISTELGD